MDVSILDGDLLNCRVAVIVNAWNRNLIPWRLLWPHGVSGAIKKRGGLQPFREIARCGPLPLGEARLTSAGTLPFRGIIHVAGIDMLWRSSEKFIRASVRSAMKIVDEQNFASVAFPIIGAGAGGMSLQRAQALMMDEFSCLTGNAQVLVVRFARGVRS